MNWENLVVSFVTSSVISALIGVFFYARNKKIDFEFNYRSYILDKRKVVYDEIESILQQMGSTNNYTFEDISKTNPIKLPMFVGYGDGHFIHDFTKRLADCVDKMYWMSPLMHGTLRKLNGILLNVTIEHHENLFTEKERVERILPFQEEFRIATSALRMIYFEDIKRLDDMKTFKKTVLR